MRSIVNKMNMFGRIDFFAFFLIFVSVFFIGPFSVQAETDNGQVENTDKEISESKEKKTVYFFDDRFCPVCQDAGEFVESVIDDYPQLELKKESITNTELVEEVASGAGIEDYRMMAPMIFINDQLLQFNSFGSRQEEMIRDAFEGERVEEDIYTYPLPFTDREITVRGWSLPAITVVLGSLDGFNVCSLGALILILSLVMVLDSRKWIFIYGGIFLLTAVTIYGVLVFVWGQVFEVLLGHLPAFQYVVGIAAGAGAIYFFKEFWRFYRFGPTCESSDSALAKRATNRLQKVFNDPSGKPAALVGGIVFFATVITIVELPCSIGVPIAFTGILIEKGVSLGAYTGYILLYLFFYMLMELIIFTGAVMTKQIWFAGSRMITWVTFVGALVLTYLSLHYLIGL
ncbi:MAG: hypothetical protein ACQEP6_02800 [Patescibacteria group bacterium]